MTLEIYYKNKMRKTQKCGLYNNVLLKTQWVKEEIKEKSENLEINENKLKTFQNLWDTTKAVLRRKFIAIRSISRNKKNFMETTYYLNELEK